MKIYDMLINRALNGGSGGGGGGDSGDDYTATVTFAVQGSDWYGAAFNVSYALNDGVSPEPTVFNTGTSLAILSTNPVMTLPLLKDAPNYWIIRMVEFYAPDGETQLQGNLLFTGNIFQDQIIYGNCTITLNLEGQ